MGRPVPFDQANATFGASQPEYLPMPAHVSQEGEITSCWELDPDELAEVQRTGRVYVTLLAFGRPPQPQIIRTSLPADIVEAPPPPQCPQCRALTSLACGATICPNRDGRDDA